MLHFHKSTCLYRERSLKNINCLDFSSMHQAKKHGRELIHRLMFVRKVVTYWRAVASDDLWPLSAPCWLQVLWSGPEGNGSLDAGPQLLPEQNTYCSSSLRHYTVCVNVKRENAVCDWDMAYIFMPYMHQEWMFFQKTFAKFFVCVSACVCVYVYFQLCIRSGAIPIGKTFF